MTDPKDLSTLLAELDAAYAEVREYGPETVNVCCKGIVALVNAYPQLREALRSLQEEANMG